MNWTTRQAFDYSGTVSGLISLLLLIVALINPTSYRADTRAKVDVDHYYFVREFNGFRSVFCHGEAIIINNENDRLPLLDVQGLTQIFGSHQGCQ